MPTPIYSIRLNPTLKAALSAIAAAEGRSLAYVIDRVLSAFVVSKASKLPNVPWRRDLRD